MVTRRGLLLAALARASFASTNATRVVLVPGAWHGGWCWDAVVPELKSKGLASAALTLTGVSERAAEASRSTSVADHVADVVRAIDAAEPGRVLLVGHSYAGLPITQAAAQRPSRLTRVVYLDAFVPAPGQSMFDLMKPGFVASWKKRCAAGDGWRVPPMLSAKAMGVDDLALAKQVDARLTPHPLRTFTDAVEFDAEALSAVPRTYVRCARYKGFGPTAARVAKEGWDVRTLDAGHDAMLSHPSAVATLLADLAA